MDFTREPIIESVITAKDGCKIVVRSSKNSGQEEFFIDSVEVVSFGSCFFFRSLEKPKAFLVPVSDYEILEVRETRMVLKNVGLDRAIKIGGGKEAKVVKEQPVEKKKEQEETESAEGEGKVDKKRDRRRNYRKRRGKEETTVVGEEETTSETESSVPQQGGEGQKETVSQPTSRPAPVFTSLLPPPPTLISETLARYKEHEDFKDLFTVREETPKVIPEEEFEDFVVEEEEVPAEVAVSEEEVGLVEEQQLLVEQDIPLPENLFFPTEHTTSEVEEESQGT